MRPLTKEEKKILRKAVCVLEIANKDEIETPHNMNVHRLAKDCLQAVIDGYGHQTIFIPSDAEGNNFNKLWYTLNTNPNELQLLKEENECMEEYKDEDIALLG